MVKSKTVRIPKPKTYKMDHSSYVNKVCRDGHVRRVKVRNKDGTLRKNVSISHFSRKSTETKRQKEARESRDTWFLFLLVIGGGIIAGVQWLWNWVMESAHNLGAAIGGLF